MNATEKTPVLTETLIETIQDRIINEEDFENNSAYLKLQYDNATPEKKEAMDLVIVCLTKKTMSAIISINNSINENNKNVG